MSLNADGSILALGSPIRSYGGNTKGKVEVFSYDGEKWNQLGSDII